MRYLYKQLKYTLFAYWSAKKLKRNLNKVIKGLVPCLVVMCFVLATPIKGYCATPLTVKTSIMQPTYDSQHPIALVYTSTGTYLISFDYGNNVSVDVGDNPTIEIDSFFWNLLVPHNDLVYANFQTSSGDGWHFELRATVTKLAYGEKDDGKIIFTGTGSMIGGVSVSGLGDIRGVQCYGFSEYTVDNSVIKTSFVVQWACVTPDGDEFDDGGYSEKSNQQKSELDSLGEQSQTSEPSKEEVGGVFDQVTRGYDSDVGFEVLKTISGTQIVSTMILVVFSMAMLGYVLFGKR